MRTPARLALLAGFAVALAGCGTGGTEPPDEAPSSPVEEPAPSTTPEPETLTLTGAVAVSGAHAIVGDGVCMAWGDYTDFNADPLQVVIKDATGTIVATVDAGTAEALDTGCIRWFTVEVPTGGNFFTASVGEWGSAAYAEADLATTNVALVVDG